MRIVLSTFIQGKYFESMLQHAYDVCAPRAFAISCSYTLRILHMRQIMTTMTYVAHARLRNIHFLAC